MQEAGRAGEVQVLHGMVQEGAKIMVLADSSNLYPFESWVTSVV